MRTGEENQADYFHRSRENKERKKEGPRDGQKEMTKTWEGEKKSFLSLLAVPNERRTTGYIASSAQY